MAISSHKTPTPRILGQKLELFGTLERVIRFHHFTLEILLKHFDNVFSYLRLRRHGCGNTSILSGCGLWQNLWHAAMDYPSEICRSWKSYQYRNGPYTRRDTPCWRCSTENAPELFRNLFSGMFLE